MISAEGVKRYCNSMYAAGAVYVWGADMETLTKELLDKLTKQHGKEHYKDIALDRDEGKLGGDCSGLLRPISGFDTTAAGYYEKCREKGSVKMLPRQKTCLLFRKEGKTIVHVAIYTGDGNLTEMWDGCEQRKYYESEWTYYGIPEWITQESETGAQKETTAYYTKYAGTSGSIVTALLSVGETDVSFGHRTKIAKANGIANYTGTAAQNIGMVNLLKKGMLARA